MEMLAWALILLRNILSHTLLDNLPRNIRIMRTLPFAQPTCLVVDRFSVILDDIAKNCPSRGAGRISSVSSKGSASEGSVPAIIWRSREGENHHPKPPVMKRHLLGTPLVPHIRPLHRFPDIIKARTGFLGPSLQRQISRNACCTRPRFKGSLLCRCSSSSLIPLHLVLPADL